MVKLIVKFYFSIKEKEEMTLLEQGISASTQRKCYCTIGKMCELKMVEIMGRME